MAADAPLSAEAMEALIDDLPIGLLVLDAELRIVHANAALRTMAGAGANELAGQRVSEALSWMPEERLRTALATGRRVDFEVGADAAIVGRKFAVGARPLEHERRPALACLVTDVTELAAWRRGLGGLERLVADVAAAATPDEVTHVIVSRSRELVGAETVAAVLLDEAGTHLELVGAAGFLDGTERKWRRFDLALNLPMNEAVRTGRPVFLDGAGDDDRSRFSDYPPALVDVTVAAVPIRGPGGVIGGLSFRFGSRSLLEPGDRSVMTTLGEHYGQALDRTRALEVAEAERERLRVLMNQLPVGVAIAEAPGGHIVAVNPKATEIWRLPPPDGEPITDLAGYAGFHPDGRRFAPGDWPIERSLAHGEVVEGEEIAVEFADGAPGFVNVSARPIYDARERMLGAVTTIVDVTEAHRREAEARFIADATDLLTESLDPEESLRRLARLVVPHLADWCVVYVRDGAAIRTVAVEHADQAKVALGLELSRRYPPDDSSRESAAWVMRTGESQLTREISREMVAAAAPDEDFVRLVYDELGLRSALTVPLRARGELFGALTLVLAGSGRRFDERDLRFAEDFAGRAALAVANARLYADQEEIARTLQRSLLPLRVPDIPGMRMTARYRAAGRGNMVGGDFYDLWAIGEDGLFGVAIGDVCGKGAAAAALTALARHTVRTASLTIPDHRPAEVLRALNDAIRKRADFGQFCTVAHAFAIPIEDGFVVTIAAGGHPLPFIVRADGTVHEAGRPGTLLGVMPQIVVNEYRTVLRTGDRLVLWTDGVSDRRGDGELFGEERLRAVLSDHAGESSDRLADAVQSAVLGFSPSEPQDDIAVVVVEAVAV